MTADPQDDTAPLLADRSILVVEDEFLIAMDLQMQLEGEGAVVTLARNLAEARAAMDTDFDASVLDMGLADGAGSDLAPDLIARGTRIVFHSGHLSSPRMEAFPEAAVVAKPSTTEQLVGALARVLDGRDRTPA